MSKTKTKRRKVWVSYMFGLPHRAKTGKFHESETDDQSRFVEVRPGDVVLSREDVEELRRIVEAYWMASGQTTTARDRALALLRGRR